MGLTQPNLIQDWRKLFPGHFETAIVEAREALDRAVVDGDPTLAFCASVEAAFNRGAQAVADVTNAIFGRTLV